MAENLQEFAGNTSVDELPISDELLAELNRRAEEHRKNPGAGITWEELDARLDKLRPEK